MRDPDARPPTHALRTVHLVQGLRAGGVERVVVDLARVARAAGHDDRILLFDRARVDPATDLDPGEVPVAFAPRRSGRDPRAVWRLARALAALAPRVVHAHNETAAVLAWLAGRLLRRAARPDLVVTLHNAPVHATSRARWLARRACRRASAVVAVSHELATRLVAEGWIDGAEVVPNGVDVDRLRPRVAPHADGPLHVGMVARLATGKRHDLLIEACARLQRDGVPLRLTLVGDGPRAAEVDRALRAVDGGRRIPHVRDPATILAELDVAALLSDHEGAPLALLEAFASGLPAVASAVGGIPELAASSDGACALLVGDSPAEVADALRRLRDPELRAALGARARRHAVTVLALRHAVERYGALYRR